MPERLLVFAAGLAGALGVILSAASAHGAGGTGAETAARFLLIHAPALLALAALAGAGAVSLRGAALGGAVLALGLALFCGDLAARAFRGAPLFPMAAPAGGLALIAGWVLIAAAALLPARPR